MSMHFNENAFFDNARPARHFPRRRDNIVDSRWPDGWWLLPMVASGAWLWWGFFSMVLGA